MTLGDIRQPVWDLPILSPNMPSDNIGCNRRLQTVVRWKGVGIRGTQF